MISITPAALVGEGAAEEDDVESITSDASEGGTIRRNCSCTQMVTEEQHKKLLLWCAREQGPWSEDLHAYPGPAIDASAAAAGGVRLAESGLAPGEEPYRPRLSGYDCELFRNEYLAWCGAVQLRPGHPDVGKKPSELSKSLKVHGGISIALPQRLQFDCNHGLIDLVPYAAFVRSVENDKRVGALVPSGSGDGRSPAGLGGSGGGGKLQIPKVSADGPAPLLRGGATYKDYKFARSELEALAAQLWMREEASMRAPTESP